MYELCVAVVIYMIGTAFGIWFQNKEWKKELHRAVRDKSVIVVDDRFYRAMDENTANDLEFEQLKKEQINAKIRSADPDHF